LFANFIAFIILTRTLFILVEILGKNRTISSKKGSTYDNSTSILHGAKTMQIIIRKAIQW
jgi:hypothetical protein